MSGPTGLELEDSCSSGSKPGACVSTSEPKSAIGSEAIGSAAQCFSTTLPLLAIGHQIIVHHYGLDLRWLSPVLAKSLVFACPGGHMLLLS